MPDWLAMYLFAGGATLLFALLFFGVPKPEEYTKEGDWVHPLYRTAVSATILFLVFAVWWGFLIFLIIGSIMHINKRKRSRRGH